MNEFKIDMTPTWEQTAQILCVVLENGTTHKALSEARQELLRMGRLMDQLIAERGA